MKFPSLWALYSKFHSVFRECDATIVTTSYIYESAGLDAMKQWFSDMQKGIHVFGPLLPPGYETRHTGAEAGVDSMEVFLREMLIQYGERSVFFVRLSFFSVFQLHGFSSDLLWYYLLAYSFGIHWWVDRSPDWKESTVCTWQLLPMQYFMIHVHYSIRSLLVHLHVPSYRSIRQKKSSRQVWEY